MKTSVSIPDELWDRVKGAGDGPSAVVQQGLTLLAEQQEQPARNVPTGASRDELVARVQAAAQRIQGGYRELSELGYRFGIEFADTLDFTTLALLPKVREHLGEWLSLLFELVSDPRHGIHDVISAAQDEGLHESIGPAAWKLMVDFGRGTILEGCAERTPRDDGSVSWYRVTQWGEFLQVDYSPEDLAGFAELTDKGIWADETVALSLLDSKHPPGVFLTSMAGALLDVRSVALRSIDAPEPEAVEPAEGGHS